MKTAMGIVAAIVNVPHGLSFNALTTTKRDHRQQNDHDQQHGHERSDAADLTDLLARHLSQRLAVAPHGAEQNDEVLNRPAQHGADDDPERAREIPELRGQRWAHQAVLGRRLPRNDGRRRSTYL